MGRKRSQAEEKKEGDSFPSAPVEGYIRGAVGWEVERSGKEALWDDWEGSE